MKPTSIAIVIRHLVLRRLHFNQFASFKHKNGVATPQCVQAMGNHESGSLLHQLFCRAKNGSFCNCIDGAGGLIENQNRAIA